MQPLARRFNEVKVNAPSAEDTFKILQGIRDLYQQHHNVILPDEVLKAAVDYSVHIFHNVACQIRLLTLWM